MILECEYRETVSASSKMPYWYYEKKALRNTPSMKDGLDYETECRYRKEGAQFIIDVGTKMDLGYNTMATGVLYFHRFYMFHSFKNFPRYVTACCCLFLAGKVEETPKKCRDIINTAKTLLTAQKFGTFGKDPKEEVMTLERILLQTIKFDLQVEHPYSYLLTYAKCLKGDKSKLQKMVQMAWNFVNDSLCTTLSLQWEPEIIAVALMYFAGKLNKFDVVDWNGRQEKHLRWWDMFVEDVTMDLLEDICHQMLDHYSQANNSRLPASPPLASSDETSRERIVAPPTIESPSNPPLPPPPNGTSVFSTLPVRNPGKATTPNKIPKMETPPLAVNGGPPPAPIEVIQPVEIPPTHFPPYPPNFLPTGMAYPALFPPTNISVPPPTVNTMNHIVSAMRHLGAAGSIPSNPPPPTSIHPFQPYGYQPNTTYFPLPNAPPPATVQRPYYPPQL